MEKSYFDKRNWTAEEQRLYDSHKKGLKTLDNFDEALGLGRLKSNIKARASKGFIGLGVLSGGAGVLLNTNNEISEILNTAIDNTAESMLGTGTIFGMTLGTVLKYFNPFGAMLGAFTFLGIAGYMSSTVKESRKEEATKDIDTLLKYTVFTNPDKYIEQATNVLRYQMGGRSLTKEQGKEIAREYLKMHLRNCAYGKGEVSLRRRIDEKCRVESRVIGVQLKNEEENTFDTMSRYPEYKKFVERDNNKTSKNNKIIDIQDFADEDTKETTSEQEEIEIFESER